MVNEKMTLIDGKATAAAIKAEIAEEVKQIVAGGGKQPHLAAVLVGHDGGSELGISFTFDLDDCVHHTFPTFFFVLALSHCWHC